MHRTDEQEKACLHLGTCSAADVPCLISASKPNSELQPTWAVVVAIVILPPTCEACSAVSAPLWLAVLHLLSLISVQVAHRHEHAVGLGAGGRGPYWGGAGS